MTRFRFSIRALLALTLVVAVAVFLWPRPDPNAPDPVWRETVLGNSEPLWNIPDVSLPSQGNGPINVTATNVGRTTLTYRGESQSRILLFQEVRGDSGWQQDAWSGEGPCEESYEIAPGESVKLEIEFFDDADGLRMLGKFAEKGTKRSGLVVLATSRSR